jgi:YHS domain-containing protein
VGHSEDERIGRLVQDPQCGVYVDSREAVGRKVGGEDRFFCSTACADAYTEARKAEGS